jgi:hypothetical protein
MINLIHMISILNLIFTIVFYSFICFEEFINQLNLLYSCIYLYLQKEKSCGTHELNRGPFFSKTSLAQ